MDENPEGSIKNQESRLRDYIKLKNHDGVFAEVEEILKHSHSYHLVYFAIHKYPDCRLLQREANVTE